MKQLPFYRCPCCGKWSTLQAFRRGATTGHAAEQGGPQGRGPWKRQPMPAKARKLLSELLRQAAQRLEEQ